VVTKGRLQVKLSIGSARFPRGAVKRRMMAAALTVHLGALLQNPWRAKFTDEPAMRRPPSALQVVLGIATAAMIVAAVTRALYIAQ
jgi:hypothetical protein